jgi:hypothetical protein
MPSVLMAEPYTVTEIKPRRMQGLFFPSLIRSRRKPCDAGLRHFESGT